MDFWTHGNVKDFFPCRHITSALCSILMTPLFKSLLNERRLLNERVRRDEPRTLGWLLHVQIRCRDEFKRKKSFAVLIDSFWCTSEGADTISDRLHLKVDDCFCETPVDSSGEMMVVWVWEKKSDQCRVETFFLFHLAHPFHAKISKEINKHISYLFFSKANLLLCTVHRLLNHSLRLSRDVSESDASLVSLFRHRRRCKNAT